MKEYPDESDLKQIREWDAIKDPFGLIEFIESVTWTPDWCIEITGKRVKRFEFHTAGWSGNEDIIDALRDNPLFFAIYWEKTHKGGHYYFKVRKLK